MQIVLSKQKFNKYYSTKYQFKIINFDKEDLDYSY